MTKAKHIPIEINNDEDNEKLELMGRYDFIKNSRVKDWGKLQSHINYQFEKLPASELVVLLYFRTPKKEA